MKTVNPIFDRPPRKILIVKPSSLGDIVHSLPFLNSLRSCFPDAKIHWVVAKGFEGILEGHQMIERLFVINKDIWRQISKAGQTIRELRGLFRELRAEEYDLVIDLQGLLRSGIITKATRAPLRVGFAEAREGSRFFYNMVVTGGREVHAVERYMKIAGALGCDSKNIVFPFAFSGDVSVKIVKIKSDLKDYSVLVPGARWTTKAWPPEKFGELAALLPIKSVLIGGRSDAKKAEKIVAMSSGKAVSLVGETSLGELVEVMRGARFVVTNDSGPMHIAAGLNIPVVAIFGPTSPLRTGPYGSNHIVISSDAECAPCFRRQCDSIKCMTSITVDKVYQRIRDSLL